MTKSRRLAAAESVLGEPVQDIVLLNRYRIPILVLAVGTGVTVAVVNVVLPSTPGVVRYLLVGLLAGIVTTLGTDLRALSTSARGLTLLRVGRLRTTPSSAIRSVDPSEVTIDAAGIDARVSIAGDEYRVARWQVDQVRAMCHAPPPDPASSSGSGGDVTA